MGWIIVCIVLLIISSLFSFISERENWDNFFLAFIFAMIGLVSFSGLCILIGIKLDTPSSEEIFVSKYNNIQEATTIMIVPSDTLIKEIFDANEEILEHKVRVNNFMTKGFYSEKIANLELLQIPESFLNVEIEYD